MAPPPPPLVGLLVARFLRTNNYTETLDAFLREAGLPSDAGETTENELASEPAGAGQWTLEGIIQEKKKFDQSLTFERHDESTSANDQWTSLAPSQPTVVETPSSTNLLHVSVKPWQRDDKESTSYVVVTGADKRLSLFNLDADQTVAASMTQLSDSPILSHASVRDGEYQFLAGMSGKLLLVQNDEVIDSRKDHSKYTVQVAAYEDRDGHIWIATAGWDAQVLVYRMKIEPSTSDVPPVIGEPVGAIKLPTNPESILITRNPDTQELTLLVSRRDSTHIYFYNLEALRSANHSTVQCEETGKQNLAPHSNAWIAFSPSCLALSPHDPGLLAVALSTMPHMKVMIVRLLFPSSSSSSTQDSTPQTRADETASVSHATQAMAALALQNREDAAIVIQANTFAPQTPYSTPQVVWRPDGSGLWVNGDDGVIRGVEAKTGKVVMMLKNGHEVGSKVRSIWAGWVDTKDSTKEEWVVSGGFDKRLIVWR